jgi:soluble lytic murein transglycosylase-like protein
MVKLHPEIYNAIWIEGKVNDLSPYLLAGVIQVESAFNPYAIGDAGKSHGLMQLHEQGAGVAKPPWQLHVIAWNVRIGTNFLRRCIDATGSTADGVSAYNQGIAGWQQNGRSINQKYVDDVLNWEVHFASEGLERMEYPDLYVRY